MNAIVDALTRLPPTTAYVAIALAVLAESILLVGAFVPTLTLLLTAGASARIGHISLALVIAAAAGAVIAGDFVGYRTGRLLGERLRTGRVGRGIPGPVWQRAETLMNRHGGRAVLFARFVPVVRTLTPHFAGAAGVPYRRIAPYSVAAACSWATIEAVVGYSAAGPLQRFLTLGWPALAALGLLAVVGCASLWMRKN